MGLSLRSFQPRPYTHISQYILSHWSIYVFPDQRHYPVIFCFSVGWFGFRWRNHSLDSLVTKIAPKGYESSCMSVHSLFTGIIGLPTPFLAYWILSTLGPAQVSWASSVVITASFLIFLKLASNKRLHPYHS